MILGCLLAGCEENPHREVQCEDVVQRDVMQEPTSVSSGLELCADGWNRAESAACLYEDPETVGSEAPGGSCSSDAGCEARSVCSYDPWSDTGTCYRQCYGDSDCESSSVCLCANIEHPPDANLYALMNLCVTAACRTNDDCNSGRCGLTRDGCDQPTGFVCRTVEDECRGDEDCDSDTPLCNYDETGGRWLCSERWGCE